MLTAVLLAVQSGSYALAESIAEESKSDEIHISVDLEGQTEDYSAVLYDNTNGLPTSEANAIAETSEGFIWIGSYAGLIRYDGNTFERVGSTGGISSIKCLYVDSRDRLWMGNNDNGVAVMEKGEFRFWGKMDGMGYPNHLKGEEIPRVAQIIAVADCFDAMYSNRPYRNRMNFDKAVSIIKEVSGTQLTPDVVDAFLRLVEKGEFREPDDMGGGSLENIENIRGKES